MKRTWLYKESALGILTIVLIQNVKAGAPIRNVDRRTDEASGPKTNLPPHKNFCKFQGTKRINYA